VNALYGRSELLARAHASLERALSGQGRLLLFTGEPGIGKSSLMEQLARDAASRGATVA
jgi:predicted ATP-dependent serine protease